jgi:hypothetical protein
VLAGAVGQDQGWVGLVLNPPRGREPTHDEVMVCGPDLKSALRRGRGPHGQGREGHGLVARPHGTRLGQWRTAVPASPTIGVYNGKLQRNLNAVGAPARGGYRRSRTRPAPGSATRPKPLRGSAGQADNRRTRSPLQSLRLDRPPRRRTCGSLDPARYTRRATCSESSRMAGRPDSTGRRPCRDHREPREPVGREGCRRTACGHA